MPEGFSWSGLGVDPARIREERAAPLPSGRREFVLYWCMVNHRVAHNHALHAAIALGNQLGLPVVCYQALRPDYPHASDRLHAFVLDGLTELTGDLAALGIPHWLELPRTAGAHVRRIGQLGSRAAAIVSDLFPAFVVPGHLRGAARSIEVPLFSVDASCVVPMSRIPMAQVGAYALRPKLRKLWPEYLEGSLALHPPRVSGARLRPDFPLANAARAREDLASFEIDHAVAPVPGVIGGRAAALKGLHLFIEKGLPRYETERNQPLGAANSALSPYLHFGHVFAGELAAAARQALGATHPAVEAYSEELLVRRELGFNYCFHTPQERQLSFRSLPPWAQQTLSDHRLDDRTAYTWAQLEQGQTEDELWNAVQAQLRESGKIEGYLRMLWGKKILEWSPTPEEALKRIALLNDRYALDGRDPVSTANFMWILGLHDRPFQERAVIGKVRPMSSARTYKKFDLKPYLRRFGGSGVPHGADDLRSSAPAQQGRRSKENR